MIALQSGQQDRLYLSFVGWLIRKSLSLTIYGARVDQLKAKVGEPVSPAALEKALKEKKYKLVAITHVDTSTGKRSEAAIC